MNSIRSSSLCLVLSDSKIDMAILDPNLMKLRLVSGLDQGTLLFGKKHIRNVSAYMYIITTSVNVIKASIES